MDILSEMVLRRPFINNYLINKNTHTYQNVKDSNYLSLRNKNVFLSLISTNPEEYDIENLEYMRDIGSLFSEDSNRYLRNIFFGYNDKFYADNKNTVDKNRYLKDELTTKDESKKIYSYNINTGYLIADAYREMCKKIDVEAVRRIFNREYSSELNSRDPNYMNMFEILYRHLIHMTTEFTKVVNFHNDQFKLFSDNEIKELSGYLDKDNLNSRNARTAFNAVKNKLNTIDKLERFRVGPSDKYIYDFRYKTNTGRITGPIIFMSEQVYRDYDMRVDKMLDSLYMYDAIVFAHGTSIPDPKDKSKYILDELVRDIKDNKNRFLEMISRYRLTVNGRRFEDVVNEKFTNIDNYKDFISHPHVEDVSNIYNFIMEKADKIIDRYDDMKLYSFMNDFDNSFKAYINALTIYRKNHKWNIQPVSTLESYNITDVEKLVRQLKYEKFKNILITACNTTNYLFSDDIEKDKSFVVTYNTSIAVKESILYNDIDLIINEANNLYESYILNESFSDKVRFVIDKLKELFFKLVDKIISFIKFIYNKIRSFIVKTRSSKLSNEKIKVYTMNSDINGYLTFKEHECNSKEEACKILINANNTILDYIDNALKIGRDIDRIIKNNKRVFDDVYIM